jgi:hypothetical protein
MKVRPIGLPDTSEFHLYAESMRMDGIAGNSEELAANPGAVIKKRILTIAQDSQKRRGKKNPIRRPTEGRLQVRQVSRLFLAF